MDRFRTLRPLGLSEVKVIEGQACAAQAESRKEVRQQGRKGALAAALSPI
jgi:hypothetical protein